MRINRLFEIVYLLMDKKNMTAHELAAHFEVSKRTILRDIDALAEAGVPIYTSQGKGGGIFIHDKYVLNKTVISEDEQKQILFALQSISATQHVETKSILSRLQSLFAKTDHDWKNEFQLPEIESLEFPSLDFVYVQLRFEPHAAYRVYDEFDERSIIKNEDGSLTVDMYLPNDNWLYEYILSFGPSVEVLEPQNVRAEIVRQAEEIKNKYANKT